MTDSDLIRRVVDTDDHAAFGELVGRHQSSVRHFLRHLTGGDAGLADDLAQDTFVQAYRGLGRFGGGSSFSTWLLGIAQNLWRNHRRKAHTVPLEPGHLEQLESAPSPAAGDLRQDLNQALRQLSKDEQTAIHLSYQQGLSHGEIAALVGWPLGTVKTHLNRAKDKLRPLLASWNPQT